MEKPLQEEIFFIRCGEGYWRDTEFGIGWFTPEKADASRFLPRQAALLLYVLGLLGHHNARAERA